MKEDDLLGDLFSGEGVAVVLDREVPDAESVVGTRDGQGPLVVGLPLDGGDLVLVPLDEGDRLLFGVPEVENLEATVVGPRGNEDGVLLVPGDYVDVALMGVDLDAALVPVVGPEVQELHGPVHGAGGNAVGVVRAELDVLYGILVVGVLCSLLLEHGTGFVLRHVELEAPIVRTGSEESKLVRGPLESVPFVVVLEVGNRAQIKGLCFSFCLFLNISVSQFLERLFQVIDLNLSRLALEGYNRVSSH